MGDKTGIEWTDATWNPLRGCSRVSEGCRNCYAEKVASRFSGPGQPYEGLATRSPARWTGEVRLIEEHLADPLRWRKPRRVFVNSMSDLFHESVPDEWIDRIFAVMALSPRHTFQVLTKRPERMQAYVTASECQERVAQAAGRRSNDGDLAISFVGGPGSPWPLPSVWLGVSIEDQATADERVPLLLDTPAAVRFISAEPLLGPVSFRWAKWHDWKGQAGTSRGTIDHLDGLRTLDWIIVGGESGPGARPFDLAWPSAVVQQCREAGVPCFVKQLGTRPVRTAHGRYVTPGTPLEEIQLADRKGGDWFEWPEDLRVREFPEAVRA